MTQGPARHTNTFEQRTCRPTNNRGAHNPRPDEGVPSCLHLTYIVARAPILESNSDAIPGAPHDRYAQRVHARPTIARGEALHTTPAGGAERERGRWTRLVARSASTSFSHPGRVAAGGSGAQGTAEREGGRGVWAGVGRWAHIRTVEGARACDAVHRRGRGQRGRHSAFGPRGPPSTADRAPHSHPRGEALRRHPAPGTRAAG